MSSSSRAIPLTALALLASAVAPVLAPPGASAKVVRYQGRAVAVPAGWPVYHLSRRPSLCVRLDRAAVYVGAPSHSERCPAHAVGRSRAIVIGPRIRREAPIATPAPRARGRTLVGATFSGLGFDACTAPSVTQMAAWTASPYRAVGIYIGGTNMGCAQPNLNAAWVSRESAAGWHLIPTYVGLQAPANSCGCGGISPRSATAQGVAAANDAATHAADLGLGRGNPIYTDMEYYPRTSTNTSAVLAFLSGWTAQLHADGYLSGVYGNSDSVIADLLTREGSGYPEPDDVWFAEWNDVQTVSSSLIPAGVWVNHRLHQYNGGHNATYGGVTINIDSNLVDGATAAAGALTTVRPPVSDGTFVQVSGKTAVYRVAGGAPLFVNNWFGFGGPQQPTVISKRQFAALNKVPANGTVLRSAPSSPYSVSNLYRVAGGAAMPITNPQLFPQSRLAVTVDQWDILNPRNPLAHLAAYPADGTVVEGLPSRTYWVFDHGARGTIAATRSSTQVDDAALAAYPMFPCIVPTLRQLTLVQAKAVLLAADCTIGKVRRPHPPGSGRLLRVVRQFPGPGARRSALKPVNLTLG
jgi:hypothetical protein